MREAWVECLQYSGDVIASATVALAYGYTMGYVPGTSLNWLFIHSTPELNHYQYRNYVRSYASYLNINSNDENPVAAYNTRVERIEKRVNLAGQEQGWRLWLKFVERTGLNTCRATWWTEARLRRFNAPSMPSIPGLKDWMRRFPNLLRHSRQYRRPEAYADQTVLIVGASVSGSEISRDLNHHARKIYVSIRDTSTFHCGLERPRRRIPENTTLIGEIDQFLPVPDRSSIQSGPIKLKNGTILSGIDSVIFATGYRYSFPFLPQYYYGATYEPHEGSASKVEPFLPAGGSDPRDLYLDQFYIQDPTLAFLNLAQGLQTFPVADYTSLALAKVWTNTAKLPNGQIMRKASENSVRLRGGYGARFAWLGCDEFPAFVRYVVGWLNEAAVKYGGKQIDGLPKDFDEIAHYWSVTRFGEPGEQKAFKD
ncbi:hypothetical protein JVU11DRAFT_10469 [Chiua virens]|nr:hypothetical protein JVU11DRAFT_10469 [Chiua virens]